MLSSKIFKSLAKFFHNHFVLKVEVSGELDRTFEEILSFLLINKLLSHGKAVSKTTNVFGGLMSTARIQISDLQPKASDAAQKLAGAKRLYSAIRKCSTDPTCQHLLVCYFFPIEIMFNKYRVRFYNIFG